MLTTRQTIADWLARSRTRAWIHAGILLFSSGAVLALMMNGGLFGSSVPEGEPAPHYLAGQLIAAVFFYLAYACIILRVLYAGVTGGSLTRTLIWVPTLLAGALIAAVAAAAAFAAGKELLDWGGGWEVSGSNLSAALNGAISVLPPVAVIMALTPLFIPLDILLQVPRLMISDIRTGIKALDGYVRERKLQTRLTGETIVLAVEDDVYCAAAILSFARLQGLKCQHVSTISEAQGYLRAHQARIRLVILDLFVRVDRPCDTRTGKEWLLELGARFPREKRPFLIVVISGHTDLLGEAAGAADLVLQKPWDPRRLEEFLRQRGIIANKKSEVRSQKAEVRSRK